MKSSRRTFLKMAGAGLALGAGSSPAATTKRNILLIHDDQHRGMDLHHAGNHQLETPHLDRLAESGVSFCNGIANHPLCTPSRATLLTGKYSLAHRTISNDLPMALGQNTIATVLRDQGYRTGYIGKWHLDGIPRSKFTPPGPRRQGFDDFWAAYNCHHNYFKTKYFLDTPELITPEGYEPNIQTDLAIDFISKYKSDPFFLMMSWGPPHAPYQLVPEEYRRMYDPEKIELRPNVEDPKRQQIADYYAAITALDRDVGRLVDTLREHGLLDNTIIVFTSDHGDMLWSQGRQKKQQPWEESIRVPLILSAPGLLPEDTRSDALFGTTDLTPTLLGLVGIENPSGMQGLDMSPRLAKGAGEEHESVPIMDVLPCDQSRAWDGRPWRGVRTKRYTYARYREKGWVLYDNEKDPYQLDNLIDKKEHRDLQAKMQAELDMWLERLDDDFLTGEGHLAQLGMTELWDRRNEHFRSGRNW